jgi:hypothetical protein
MDSRLCQGVCAILLAGTATSFAAPQIPSGALPGQERERFTPSPLDRYFDPRNPTQRAEPLYRWECGERTTQHPKRQQAKRNPKC